MPRLLLDLEFDGRAFQGTQAQGKGERTLVGVVKDSFQQAFGLEAVLRPASRLDAGVSAASLPIDVWMDRLPGRGDDPRVVGLGLSVALPVDVAERRVALVPDDFSARIAATGKTYVYRVLVRPTAPALDRRVWWVRQLDHPDMLQGLADHLIGTQDLRAFACLRGDGTDEDDGARTITRATWAWTDHQAGRLGVFTVEGTGFLYKQIRGFVGAMVFTAQGRRPVEDYLARCAGDTSRARIGNIAPPEGLVLERVHFATEPAWA